MPTLEAALSTADLHALRERLAAERRAILAAYAHDLELERGIPHDEVGDAVDHAEAEVDRGALLTLAAEERERLQLVDEALDRIDAGHYGRCQADGEAIPLERLRAVPWARFCAAHQEAWEADHRARHERRGGASFARG